MNEKEPAAPYMQFSNQAINMGPPHQAMNMGPPQTVVVRGMPSGQSTEMKWTWCHLVTSVISVFLCCCCGIPAMVLSLLSYIEHRTNLHETSRQKRNVALGLGIAGIVVGSILIILTITFYAAMISSYIAALYGGGY